MKINKFTFDVAYCLLFLCFPVKSDEDEMGNELENKK